MARKKPLFCGLHADPTPAVRLGLALLPFVLVLAAYLAAAEVRVDVGLNRLIEFGPTAVLILHVEYEAVRWHAVPHEFDSERAVDESVPFRFRGDLNPG